ncbi:MAG: hypothetical protein ACTSX1_15785, partial [Candidatus Heimdallarchaeaceae archaeon]
SILIATCNKLFNGKSVFGIRGTRRDTVNVGAIVMDDAHKCLDIIRETFSIKAYKTNEDETNPIYTELWSLFETSLKEQASGTFSDMQKERDVLMAVPHWVWFDKRDDILEILSRYSSRPEIEWAWNLIRDHLSESTCVFSGKALEISPRLLPIDRFPSFVNAKRRLFLSATLTEDSFLVRDMDIDKDSVLKPITSNEKYSGERLIVLPALVDPYLTRLELIQWVQNISRNNGNFGVVAITPSNPHADAWSSDYSEITHVRKIDQTINQLSSLISQGVAHKVMVLVNAYDGVDLPHNLCRVLTLDSLPKYNTLIDEYQQEMRPQSVQLRKKLAQRIEQGMGRAIRGSGDWCIVVVIGNDITNFLSEKSKRKYLSNEAQMQIKIGEDLAKEMKEEGGSLPAMEQLLRQCIDRDENWRVYYNSVMTQIQPAFASKEYLDQALIEREAELLYRNGMYKPASDKLNYYISNLDENDSGWYLQLMSTYLYPLDKASSMDKQVKAHIENPSLFRPPIGITFQKMAIKGTRASRILDWIQGYESYTSIILDITENLSDLNFGAPHKKFEQSMANIGASIGITSSRPEQLYGDGPDVLWQISKNENWVIECKNEVEVGRPSISKDEIGQLSNSIGWHEENYSGTEKKAVLVHPTNVISSLAHPNYPVYVMKKEALWAFKENVRNFFTSLSNSLEITSLNESIINEKLQESYLDDTNLHQKYLEREVSER